MKINRKVKMLLGTFCGIVLFLFIVLVVHIATVEPVEIDNATLQISRIDFETPLDSVETIEVHRNLKSINGVKNIKIFSEKGIVVYFHDNRVVNAEHVFNQFSSLGNYKAKPFIVSQEIASKKVCPAMNTNSFGYKFSRGIQRIFN